MSALDDVGLEATPISDLLDVELLREIRNECRLFMTGDIKPITPEAQSAWYDEYVSHGRNVIEVWLIGRSTDPYPIGFLALRYYHETTRPGAPHKTYGRGKAGSIDSKNHAVITLGLIEPERGRSYGTAIYRYAREVAGCPIRAEIYRTNTGSIKAAEKAGYVESAPYTAPFSGAPISDNNVETVTLWALSSREER